MQHPLSKIMTEAKKTQIIIKDAVAAAKAYQQNSDEGNRKRYEDAFNLLFKSYYLKLLKFFTNRGLLKEDADDLSSATVENLWEFLHKMAFGEEKTNGSCTEI